MPARTLQAFDPEAVASWTLGEGRRGVLLLHGFAGTPPELRLMGEHLAARGFHCRGPALTGHGGTPEDLEASTRLDWLRSAQSELDALAARCDQVVVVGQSMGGTIALHLAATDLRVSAVATLAAPVWLRGLGPRLVPLLQHVMRWHYPGSDVDLYDVEATDLLHSHGRRPLRAVAEFERLIAEVRAELPCVRAPVLVMHGGRDRTIDPGNADEIARRLVCSRRVLRRGFPRSGHGMSVDVDRTEVAAAVSQWFEEHVPARQQPG